MAQFVGAAVARPSTVCSNIGATSVPRGARHVDQVQGRTPRSRGTGGPENKLSVGVISASS